MKNKLLQKTTNTLRGRLSLWYILSVSLIILLSLTAVSTLFWITLQDQIDHHVHTVVNEAKQIVENYQGKERDELIKNFVTVRGMTVVVLSPDGSAILETNSPDIASVTEHQLQKILTLRSLYESTPAHFTENNIRFAALPAKINAGKGIVAVGYSTQILYATFYKLISIIIAVAVFLIIPITVIGYKFLKKQLLPLENIANQARLVSGTSSLSKRINITSPTEELKTIQEALNTMLTKLEEIFKSEREFFSDAAHTLKTPLAILKSQIENSNLIQGKREEMLKTIDNANETAQDLILLSKINNKPQKLETVSLTNLITDLSELAETLGENKKLNISKDIETNILLKADKRLLQRALSNIIFNSIIYNKEFGNVHIGLGKQKNKIIVIVKDTGIGITKHDLPLVFSRFFRGSNNIDKGSGLGLAISKAILESFGAKINISSSINKGTTISIIFS
ncbi:hypothetical protein C4577_03345 [Candidatus Parcubacteria bacterium]|nr:MAG: hypothetical protein C4577_03345 [Candidatus Parcubacteria bacterium]